MENQSNSRRSALNGLHDFLTLNYAELEELNLKAKEQRLNRVPSTRSRKNA